MVCGPDPVGMRGTVRTGRRPRSVALLVLLGGLALSAVLTVIFWPAGMFLFLPFLFFPFGRLGARAPARTCGRCGCVLWDPEDRFCPRDGEPVAAAPKGR